MSKKDVSIQENVAQFIKNNESDEVNSLYDDLIDIFGKESDVLTFNQKLRLAVKDIENSNDKIDYDGRKYTTVAKRLDTLRRYFGLDVSIKTENISINDSVVIFKATIIVNTEKGPREIATGHAEEKRSASKINEVAAFEVAETSAIGRALANTGLSGGEFASANELSAVGALKAKASDEIVNHLKALAKTSKTSWKAALATQNVTDENDFTEEKAIKLLTIFLKTIGNNAKNESTSAKIKEDAKVKKDTNEKQQKLKNDEEEDEIPL